MRLVVLASGGATDAGALIREIEAGRLNAEIRALISDRADSYALVRAREHHIPALLISPQDRMVADFEEDIANTLYELDSDLILLLGWMRLLGPRFVRRYGHMTWNIHPSLLPLCAGGMDRGVHEVLLRRGAKLTGCSLIQIDEGADTGPIILQRAVGIQGDDTIEELRTRVQAAEQEILLEAIRLFMADRLELATNRYGGKYYRILPAQRD